MRRLMTAIGPNAKSGPATKQSANRGKSEMAERTFTQRRIPNSPSQMQIEATGVWRQRPDVGARTAHISGITRSEGLPDPINTGNHARNGLDRNHCDRHGDRARPCVLTRATRIFLLRPSPWRRSLLRPRRCSIVPRKESALWRNRFLLACFCWQRSIPDLTKGRTTGSRCGLALPIYCLRSRCGGRVLDPAGCEVSREALQQESSLPKYGRERRRFCHAIANFGRCLTRAILTSTI